MNDERQAPRTAPNYMLVLVSTLAAVAACAVTRHCLRLILHPRMRALRQTLHLEYERYGKLLPSEYGHIGQHSARDCGRQGERSNRVADRNPPLTCPTADAAADRQQNARIGKGQLHRCRLRFGVWGRTQSGHCGAAPRREGFGFDIDVRLVTLARENVRRNGVENLVQIELRDMFSLDLSKADVVFLFLPRQNP